MAIEEGTIRTLHAAQAGRAARFPALELGWHACPEPQHQLHVVSQRASRQVALRKGEWDGRQLISAKFLKESTTSSQELNKIYVVPSLDLVVLRHGGAAGLPPASGGEGAGPDAFDNQLLGRVSRAVK